MQYGHIGVVYIVTFMVNPIIVLYLITFLKADIYKFNGFDRHLCA